MEELRLCLTDHYDEIADSRVGGPAGGGTFMIDDGGRSHAETPGEPHTGTCQVVARVWDAGTVSVCLRWKTLRSSEILAWARETGASVSVAADVVIEFPVSPYTLFRLGRLAGLIETMIGSDAPPYSVGAYSYICARAAHALRRLAVVLQDYWGVSKVQGFLSEESR